MRLILSSLLATLVIPFAFAFEVPPNDGFVTDTAGVLTEDQEADLEQKLQIYREQTSNEIAERLRRLQLRVGLHGDE